MGRRQEVRVNPVRPLRYIAAAILSFLLLSE